MSKKKLISEWWFNESLIITVIIINAISIFIYAFPNLDRRLELTLIAIDELCALYFLFEVIIKIKIIGFKSFWERAWDRFDLILVIITLPAIIEPFLPPDQFIHVIASLRLLRLIRLLKLLKFIPNSTMLISGLKRALKASIGVVLCLFILNVIFALGATILFRDTQGAEQYFQTPIDSMYTMFKVFTVEGWYEIPDMIAESDNPTWKIWLMRSYFTLSVGVGGLLGLSLANAIFVDEMTLDNNIKLEGMIEELTKEIKDLKGKLDDKA
ncbi:MAG: ion transporter [Lentisphaeraceae bacterium]|nr:ion transporter [Lentisphaeraceae bacterium]